MNRRAWRAIVHRVSKSQTWPSGEHIHTHTYTHVHFIYGNVYVWMLLSQVMPPSPSCPVTIHLFIMSVSPLLPCKQDHRYHLSRFYIYVLICEFVFLFLTYFICIIGSKFIHCIRIDSNVFLSIAEQYFIVYGMYTIMYHNFFIHSSVDRQLGCFHVLAIVNQCCNEHWGRCVFFN